MTNITPIRRDLRFPLDGGVIHNWHAQGPQVTAFLNGMSLLFPVGERFFIKSLRQYREQITDEQLQKSVTAFIGQEAMHGREHENFNRLMEEAGLPAEKLEKQVVALLGFFQKNVSKQAQLNGTMALEHFTAILADLLLTHPEDMLGDSDKEFSALLKWHALEETEHKAVAFDVYNHVIKQGPSAYLQRSGWMLVSTALILVMMGQFQLRCGLASKEPQRLGDWLNYGKFLLGRKGALVRIAKPWLDYFKPGFHPWNHDNREFLSQLPELEEAYTYSHPKPKAA